MASDQIGAGFASLNRSSKGDFMTIDLTRRTLLHLAGASSLSAAAVAAAQAEGTASGGGPTFANRTPMRIGTVTLRVRDLISSPIIIATRSA
jgi:hypothetical protein